MGMKGENFNQRVKRELVLKPTACNNTTVNGAWINEPWRKGRQITFLVSLDLPASSSMSVKVIGKRRDNGNTDILVDKAAAEVQFPAAKLVVDGDAETKGLMGTIDLEDIKAETYSDVSLRFINAAVAAAVVEAQAIISDLYDIPSNEVDDLAAVVWA